MPEAESVVVFAGPSLPRRPDPGWRELLARCALRPPARRGDVLAVLAGGPRTVVLLDGYYYTVPSVSHKELLYALDAGVRVIGAASLGALRAVELAPQGMIGAGRIFEDYRDGRIDGDDEVALLHAPAENGYHPFTVALVEVRHALRRLPDPPEEERGRRLIDLLKELAFTERRPRDVSRLAGEILGAEAGRALDEALAAVSVKERDAREALELALRPAAPSPPRRRRTTGYLTRFQEACLRPPSRDGSPSPTLLHAWNVAQALHPEAGDFVRQLRLRRLLAAATVVQGVTLSRERERRLARELRGRHERLLGGACLPEPEYAAEAAAQALAEEAAPDALAALARSLGLAPGTEAEACLHALTGQSDTVPAWYFARAFTFTRAFLPALEAANLAEEAARRRRDSGGRFTPEELHGLACRLWRCAPSEVAAEGSRRGLFPSHTLSDGLQDALELLAPLELPGGEREAWRERCEALRRAPLLPPQPSSVLSRPARTSTSSRRIE